MNAKAVKGGTVVAVVGFVIAIVGWIISGIPVTEEDCVSIWFFEGCSEETSYPYAGPGFALMIGGGLMAVIGVIALIIGATMKTAPPGPQLYTQQQSYQVQQPQAQPQPYQVQQPQQTMQGGLCPQCGSPYPPSVTYCSACGLRFQ